MPTSKARYIMIGAFLRKWGIRAGAATEHLEAQNERPMKSHHLLLPRSGLRLACTIPARLFLAVLAQCLLLVAAIAQEKPGAAIDWQPWSDNIFARAKAEQKLVLLDLGAVWCHWCHVMDEITYRDPEVIRLLGERYIAV